MEKSSQENGKEESLVRMGYDSACEAAINDQINVEYNISYIYHSLYAHFDRANIALKGAAAYFKAASEEERGHAQGLMEYQNLRGGKVKLQSLLLPELDVFNEEKGDLLSAFEVTLSLEKLNFDKLLAMHAVASEANDVQMCEFIEAAYLTEQVEAIKEVSEYVTQLRMVGKGHGAWDWDKQLLEKQAA